jgi:argininosuccinate lyase
MRARSGSVFGAFAGALVTVKGLPMSYNRDLQELTPNIWRGMRDAKESLRLLIDMLSSATFDTGRMKEEAGKGFSTATELADTLVRTYGLPFRTAHTIVGRAVQKGDLSLSTLEEAARETGGVSLAEKGVTQKTIDEVLDVQYSIALRRATGGPAPFAIRIALEECKKHLDLDSASLDQALLKLSTAKEDLITKARRLIA